jgi:hypothetical protein
MHIISLLNKEWFRSKKKFFNLGEAFAYLTGHSGRRGGAYYMHFRPEKVLDNYYSPLPPIKGFIRNKAETVSYIICASGA